jgi:alpha-acetolactate decarboxylase
LRASAWRRVCRIVVAQCPIERLSARRDSHADSPIDSARLILRSRLTTTYRGEEFAMQKRVPCAVTALIGQLVLSIAVLFGPTPAADAAELVQYGTMHEAIGQQQSEGRVVLAELLERPHFFGVGALEGLQGEITAYDGKIVITTVGADGKWQAGPDAPTDEQATLLVGAYADTWSEVSLHNDVPAANFDALVSTIAENAVPGLEQPFMFTIEGDFENVRLHVINGACPLHSRMHKVELPEESRPFEGEIDAVSGRIVGVFAKDAVGRLTHPATSTHTHILFDDPATGKTITGHIERLDIVKGATLRLPGG